MITVNMLPIDLKGNSRYVHYTWNYVTLVSVATETLVKGFCYNINWRLCLHNWREIMPQGESSLQNTWESDEIILVTNVEILSSVLCYTIQWSQFPALRYKSACIVCNNRIHVTAGQFTVARGISSAEVYDPW